MASSEDNISKLKLTHKGKDSSDGHTHPDKAVTAAFDRTHVLSHKTIDCFDFYSCEEAVKRLNEYLDSELTPQEREEVIKHLKICEPCLERFTFEKNLVMVIRQQVCRSLAPLKLKQRLAALLKPGF